MGNHSIDCEFCGKDQRLVGPRCCAEKIAADDAVEAEIRARCDSDTQYLARFGLEPRLNSLGHATQLDARDVVAVFRHLEAKGLLTSRRGVSPKPPRPSRV